MADNQEQKSSLRKFLSKEALIATVSAVGAAIMAPLAGAVTGAYYGWQAAGVDPSASRTRKVISAIVGGAVGFGIGFAALPLHAVPGVGTAMVGVVTAAGAVAVSGYIGDKASRFLTGNLSKSSTPQVAQAHQRTPRFERQQQTNITPVFHNKVRGLEDILVHNSQKQATPRRRENGNIVSPRTPRSARSVKSPRSPRGI